MRWSLFGVGTASNAVKKNGEQGMGFWFISRHRSDAFSTAGLLIGHENQEFMKYLEILKPYSSRIKGDKFFLFKSVYRFWCFLQFVFVFILLFIN